MGRKFTSRAEELRHHRKCFELALELGCTPREAEQRMALTEIRERQRAREQARQRRFGKRNIETGPERFEDFDVPWMMRD